MLWNQRQAIGFLEIAAELRQELIGADTNACVQMPLVGDTFGDLYDVSTAVILCLAGATVTMGLRNLLPHYLRRLGMEVSWAGRVGIILHVLNAVVLLITVVFRARPAVLSASLPVPPRTFGATVIIISKPLRPSASCGNDHSTICPQAHSHA